MREKVLLVGESPALVGVLTEPEGQPCAERPTLLVLNSGLVPRVGPYRASVHMCRRAASEGFASVRFDLSGVGDSDARRDQASFEERWVADTRAVMDHLAATRGARRFVLMGLCSGADNSFQTAKRDERVAGVVLLDGYAYKTPGYYARYYGERLLRPSTVARHAARLTRSIAAKLGGRSAPRPTDTSATPGPGEVGEASPQASTNAQYVREFPPRDEVASDLRAMVGRGAQLCVVHSGGMEIYYNHESQFRDAFRDVDFGDALTVHYFPEADHTFTELAQQRALHDAVATWLVRSFPRAR